jgi:ABC-2 type transport system permease protein
VAELVLVYRRLVGARIRSQYQYRLSFYLFLISQFLITFIDFLAVLVIFTHIPTLGGWSLPEVAFLYGVSGIAFNVADLFVSQVERTSTRIKDGTFDLVLIRPLGSLFQLSSDEFELRRLGKLAQSATVLAYAVSRLTVHWTAGRVAVTIASIGAGSVIFGSIWVIGAATTFWTIDTNEVVNSFTYGGNFLTQYPLQIYGELLRRVLAFVVPLAFVAFFPALYVLGKPDPFHAPAAVHLLSPAVAAVMAIAASLAWRGGVRHYRSTGS